jgi:hypothetical protein
MVPSAVVVKEIRPDRFKDKDFKKPILKAAEAYSKELLADFEATTKTWKTEVEFEREVDYKPNGPEVFVGTDNEIYGYVNNGTRPHPIFPVRAKMLRFQWGGKGSYTPKTAPRVIGSRSGGPSGPIVHRPYVQHPGTEARHFDEEIEKKHGPKFKRAMEKAMSDARKASGHAI